MEEPIWIWDETVSAIHGRQLAEHGGLAGVRDQGGLESAPARPKQLFAYGDPAPDYAALAAAYASGCVRNHPFVDGNKRVGFSVAVTFLRLNGWDLAVTQAEAAAATLGLASREISEDEYAAWMRSHLKPFEGGRSYPE